LVKSIVSGDTLCARALLPTVQFQADFEADNVAGNHKPIVRGSDHGIWRRIRLVPFNRTFAEDEKDTKLLDKLKAEAPHILAWMVAGCVEWTRHGLADTPAKIREATNAYQIDQDLTGTWLASARSACSHGEITSRDLYANYKNGVSTTATSREQRITLGRRLSERGYRSAVKRQAILVRLKPDGFAASGLRQRKRRLLMTPINVNRSSIVRIVRQVPHFHKVFMKTVCALNIGKRAFAALAALIRLSTWRTGGEA
jgi:hypothetical protein